MKDTNFLIPEGLSTAWIERFKLLEFVIGNDGYLYSPKVWDDDWDNQTKAIYMRSIGIAPQNIAKSLNVELTTVKNRWISNITRNYLLKGATRSDWSDRGFVDNYLKSHMNYGGVPELPDPQSDMDGELLQFLHDNTDVPEESKPSNPSDDLYKEYYGDYEG